MSSGAWPALGGFFASLAWAGLLASVAACTAEPIRSPDERRVASAAVRPQPRASHDLKLYVYTFHGTRWSPEAIRNAVVEAGRLLAQCRIALDGIELRTLDTPRQFHFYSTPMSRLLLRSIDVPRPALFFVDDTLNRPAFDAEAIGLANAQSRPELANTIWVAYGARDLPYALAHELVHVLSDSGDHSDEPGNLMRAETSPENNTLSAAQCERLRTRGAANSLLKPR